MKDQATKHTKTMKHIFQYAVAMLSVLLFSGTAFSQPPPPTGSGGSGTLPDSPLGVPFDSNMNMMLLFVGVVFALVVMRRVKKVWIKKDAANVQVK